MPLYFSLINSSLLNSHSFRNPSILFSLFDAGIQQMLQQNGQLRSAPVSYYNRHGRLQNGQYVLWRHGWLRQTPHEIGTQFSGQIKSARE
jgi:hypothetical protein